MTPLPLPKPGDVAAGHTILTAVWLDEDDGAYLTLELLGQTDPQTYAVAEYEADGGFLVDERGRFDTFDEAVRCFREETS